ncbi:MAG: anaerobic sulfite reductase subunit AsrA [Brevinema sp.]
MKRKYSFSEFNLVIEDILKTYDVYAPVTFPDKGMFSDLPLVRYSAITDITQINTKDKSFYSPKETVIPITQRLFYFNEEGFSEASLDQVRPALVFLRSCDLHAFDKLDHIYLKNKFSDKYYKQARDKIKFVVMGCDKSWDTCFCVSMGTNKAENYSLGVNIDDGKKEVCVDVQDKMLTSYFEKSGKTTEFEVAHVTKNIEEVKIAKGITLKEATDLGDFWREYDRCIGCGRCNFVCPTCSCYTTQDVFYKDNPRQGERRRVWASCHVEKFTNMAGGHSFRQKTGDRMRFKVMHKISDFARRFNTHMCVGCGRCDTACPEYISYINCINKVSDAVESKRKG